MLPTARILAVGSISNLLGAKPLKVVRTCILHSKKIAIYVWINVSSKNLGSDVSMGPLKPNRAKF